jgi:hypothetical protein
MTKLNPEELNEQDKEILAKVMANMAKQPEHRFAAIIDPETGAIIKSHKLGDNPPETKVIKE